MVPEEYDEYDVLADTIFMVLYCFLETFWLSFIHYNTNLQGVPQYSIHFYFLMTRLPRGLEIPSWTFFNSPFCVDFKNM